MSDQLSNDDVPVTINRRKALLSKRDGGVDISFTSADSSVHLPEDAMAAQLCLNDNVAVCLASPAHVVPGTKKAVQSFIIQNMDPAAAEHFFPAMIRTTLLSTTLCGRYSVTQRPHVSVWAKNSCQYIPNVKHVVVQRTKGGMSTFDAHIVPPTQSVVTVEMLGHTDLLTWRNMFHENMIDFGADPVAPRKVEAARDAEGGIAGLLDAMYASGDACADSDEQHSCSEDDDDEYVADDTDEDAYSTSESELSELSEPSDTSSDDDDAESDNSIIDLVSDDESGSMSDASTDSMVE